MVVIGYVLYYFFVTHLPVSELFMRLGWVSRLQVHLVGTLMAERFQPVVISELPGRDRRGDDHRFVEEAGGETMFPTTVHDRLS